MNKILNALKTPFSKANAGLPQGGASLLNAGANILGGIGHNVISGGLESGVGTAINSVGSTLGGALSMVNPLLGGAVTAASGVVSGLTNALFGSDLNEENISRIESQLKTANAFTSNVGSFDELSSTYSIAPSIDHFSRSTIGTDGVFSNTAANKYKKLSGEKDIATNWVDKTLLNNLSNIKTNTKQSLDANFFKNGGKYKKVDFNTYKPLYDRKFIPENMNIIQDSLIGRKVFDDNHRLAILSSLIHETGGDPEAVDATGKYKGIAQWEDSRYPNSPLLSEQITTLMDEVLASKSPGWTHGGAGYPYTRSYKDSYNGFWDGDDLYEMTQYLNKGYFRPKQEQARVNRAREAEHMSKYLKAEGGPLTHGANFTNGLTFVNNGGTHEENINGGVPMGVDMEGIPNLVEEGEVVWNDYVFSNRLKPSEKFKKQNKIKGDTFADAVKFIQKESEERPNDPISKRGLENNMLKLLMEQEQMRAKDNKKEANTFSKGGDKRPIKSPISQEIKPVHTEFNPTLKWRGPEFPIDNTIDVSALRYAPIVGSAIGTIESSFNKPDYSNADLIENAANQAGVYTSMKSTPISNYLTYRPFDTDHLSNMMRGQAEASRRALTNQSAGNRATAIAGLLALDRNYQDAIGAALREGEAYNRTQEQTVEQFNRDTNKYNADSALQAARFNQAARQTALNAQLSGLSQVAGIREAIDQQRAAARNANITNLFDNLGALGKEQTLINMFNNNPAILYKVLSGEYKGNVGAKGGYLTIKNKKRRK